MALRKVGHTWIDIDEIAIAIVENGMPVVYLKTSGVRVTLPGVDTGGEWLAKVRANREVEVQDT